MQKWKQAEDKRIYEFKKLVRFLIHCDCLISHIHSLCAQIVSLNVKVLFRLACSTEKRSTSFCEKPQKTVRLPYFTSLLLSPCDFVYMAL